ncbi:MAG: WD40/YVTN/BNR-like repeat-containing protein [Candidatus Binatia bacterium]
MTTAETKDHALHLATHSGWYRFERRGADWRQVDRALTYWQMSCIEVAPDDAKKVYIGTEHSGMFVSNDAGKEWTRANPNVPCLTMSAMLALPGRLFVGTMPAALYVTSENGGWQELKGVRQGAVDGTFPPNPDFAPRTRVLKNEKQPGGRLYAGIEVGGILASDDDGQTWNPINEGLTDLDLHQILPSKTKAGLVVAACGEGVSRSTDRGDHWEKVTPPGSRTYGNALAEDADGNIYLGITQDRPRTWTRAGRAKSAIFKLTNGADWQLVTENMSGGVMDVCTAPDGNGVLAATADGEVVVITPSGETRTIVSGLPCITAMALGE